MTGSDYVEPDDYNGALRAARELWGDELDPRVLVYPAGGARMSEPTIEQQIAELIAAGWVKVRGYVWKAPYGGYFIGPHGAWKVMKAREERDAASLGGRRRYPRSAPD